MTLYRPLYYFFILPTLFTIGCRTNSVNADKPINDTTAALSILLNKDFLSRNMPGFGGLQKQSPYGDTIIFRIDSITTGHLPENINGFHFKFLTTDQICEEAIKHYTDTTYFPDFFKLNSFQKRDSIYDISLQVTCVIPNYDRNGKRLFVNDPTSFKCTFGMLCGGGINVTVYKENGTLKIRKESSWSD
jgi:hypothetical protein